MHTLLPVLGIVVVLSVILVYIWGLYNEYIKDGEGND